MKQLWDKDPLYELGRRYVDSIVRLSFKHLTEKGRENIPEDGAVIYAANHCNTLMDALVVLQSHKGPLVFGARADVFKRPKVAAIMNWLRIVPIFRHRDGVKAMEGNQAVFDKVVETLGHGVPFAIYPEGTHRTKHSLMPLKKGVFRIAIQACRSFEGPVRIVPVGLDYSDYFHYRNNLTITFSEPIDVRKELYAAEDDQIAITRMQDMLFKRISESITYFPDDSDYDDSWAEYLIAHTPVHSPARMFFRKLYAVLSLPFFVLFGLLSLIIWIPSELLVRKTKDKAWSNTIRFGFRLALTPLQLILIAIPAFILAPWYIAVAILFFSYFSVGFFYDLLNYYNIVIHEK